MWAQEEYDYEEDDVKEVTQHMAGSGLDEGRPAYGYMAPETPDMDAEGERDAPGERETPDAAEILTSEDEEPQVTEMTYNLPDQNI